jgi:hypothetical protein
MTHLMQIVAGFQKPQTLTVRGRCPRRLSAIGSPDMAELP